MEPGHFIWRWVGLYRALEVNIIPLLQIFQVYGFTNLKPNCWWI